MLFEDAAGSALYLQVAVWENNRYIDSLREALDDRSRLTRYQVDQRPETEPFEDYYIWEVDTGVIGLGVGFEPADRFYTIFLAIGPDIDSVEDAVYAARKNLITNESAGDSDTGIER